MSKRECKNVWNRSTSQDTAQRYANLLPNVTNEFVQRSRSLAWQRPGLNGGARGRDTVFQETARPAHAQADTAGFDFATCGRPSAQVLTGAGPAPADSDSRRGPLPFKWSKQHDMARSCTAAVLAAAASGRQAALAQATAGREPANKSNSVATLARIVNDSSLMSQEAYRRAAHAMPELQLLGMRQPAMVSALPVSPLPPPQPTSHSISCPNRGTRPKRKTVWLRSQIAPAASPLSEPLSQPFNPVCKRESLDEGIGPSQTEAARVRRARTWTRAPDAPGSSGARSSGGITFVKGSRPAASPARRYQGATLRNAKSPAPAPRSSPSSWTYHKPAPHPSRIGAGGRATRVRVLSWRKAVSGCASPGSHAGGQGSAKSAALPGPVPGPVPAPGRSTAAQVSRASRRWSAHGVGSGASAPCPTAGVPTQLRRKALMTRRSANLDSPGTRAALKLPGGGVQRYRRLRSATGSAKPSALSFYRSSAVVSRNRLVGAGGAGAGAGTGAARGVPSSQAYARSPTIFCPTFCRSGYCKKRGNGACKYCHDVSKVAVCPAWLSGHCSADRCPLQHVLVPSLMPVCTFFLQGACSKAECPYLHVNLDPAAAACKAFLNGYCERGASCRAKHLTKFMLRDSCPKRLPSSVGREASRKRPRVTAMASDIAIDDNICISKCDDMLLDKVSKNVEGIDCEVTDNSTRWENFIALPDDIDSA